MVWLWRVGGRHGCFPDRSELFGTTTCRHMEFRLLPWSLLVFLGLLPPPQLQRPICRRRRKGTNPAANRRRPGPYLAGCRRGKGEYYGQLGGSKPATVTPMTTRLAPEQRAEIQKLARAGWRPSEIARKIGCDRHSVGRYVEAAPPQASAPQGQVFTETEQRWLRALAQATDGPTCSRCHQRFVALKSMTIGACPSCGAPWSRAVTTPARRQQR